MRSPIGNILEQIFPAQLRGTSALSCGKESFGLRKWRGKDTETRSHHHRKAIKGSP